jgi:hypothetical protein
MKLNSMHILADLRLAGASPIYLIKEKAKHAMKYPFSKYAHIRFSRAKKRYNLDKTPRRPRSHTKM